MKEEKDLGAVVVTGASSGIGEACALRLDRRGFTVFAGVRKADDGEALKSQASPRLSPLMIDVADDASIANAAKTVGDAVGASGLAGLVNNAGVVLPGPLEYLPIADLRAQLEVNVIGQVAVTQAFLPMIRAGHGRIVNIGSIGGKVAPPFMGAYGASKFAMEALTDALRIELSPWGIHVAIIEPGAIDTRIWGKGLAAGDALLETMPAEVENRYGEAIAALKRRAKKNSEDGIPPEEVAKAVSHALSSKKPKTRYVVGRDAQIQAMLARIAPDTLRDRLIKNTIGLPGAAPEG